MIFELIQAIGGIMNIKWAAQAVITQGPYCTAQGALKQIGDTGVALISLTIAVHTFCVLIFHWRSSPMNALLIIGLIWVFIALIVGITFAIHRGQVYYGDTEYWCWITSRYNRERIGLQYIWLWIAAFVDVILYAFLALVVKGFIIVNGGSIRVTTGEERVHKCLTSQRSGGSRDATTTVAIGLLFYPAVYLVTVIPIAVVRWTSFSNPNASVPFGATAFAGILFGLSGAFNVILFACTRPNLLPSREPAVSMSLESPTTSYNAQRVKSHLRDSITDEVGDWMTPSNRAVCSPRSPKFSTIIV